MDRPKGLIQELIFPVFFLIIFQKFFRNFLIIPKRAAYENILSTRPSNLQRIFLGMFHRILPRILPKILSEIIPRHSPTTFSSIISKISPEILLKIHPKVLPMILPGIVSTSSEETLLRILLEILRFLR